MEFSKIAEQYTGKQIPVDIDPTSKELIYLLIEISGPDVQKTDSAEVPYIGMITMRVPNTHNNNSVYILVATYIYEDGQWKFQSATQELQGGGQDKVFDTPIFKPELLK